MLADILVAHGLLVVQCLVCVMNTVHFVALRNGETDWTFYGERRTW